MRFIEASPDQTASVVIASEQTSRKTIYAALLLLIIVATLFTYKSSAALAVIQKVQNTGAFQPRPNVVPLPGNSLQLSVVARSINYFLVIWPALLFGILISGAVRVLDPPRWWSRMLGNGYWRSNLVAGVAGVPLMLCSCCAAPIFSSVYEKSSRLGPALAITLAAPSLNPAALILTFMLFGGYIGATRLAMAGFAVFLTSLLVDRVFSSGRIKCEVAAEERSEPIPIAFLRSCLQVAVRTVPLIIVGVLISMLVALSLPSGILTSGWGKIASIVVVALIAVPLALPTFFEIPLALILISAGAPVAAAVPLLIAGPAVNLPSLLTIARTSSWKVAATVAGTILLLAIAGGLFASFF
jgi:uncharacterized membrane protein YraQ (UPF0718 family)